MTIHKLLLLGLALAALLSLALSSEDCSAYTDVEKPPVPKVYRSSMIFVSNETFSLNCTVDYEKKTIVNLSWIYPNGLTMANFSIDTNEIEGVTGKLYKNITVYNASQKYAGIYRCISSNTCGNEKSLPLKKVFKPKPYLNLNNPQPKVLIRTDNFRILIYVEAYPIPTITLYKDGKQLPENTTKYELQLDWTLGTATLGKKENWELSDIGNYTLRAQNHYNMTNETNVELFVTGNATIVNFDSSDKFCVIGTTVSLSCDVSGYPLPNVTWEFATANTTLNKTSTSYLTKSFYNATAFLDIYCSQPGKITCTAKNKYVYKNNTKTRNLLIYEIADGFGIIPNVVDNTHRYLEKQNLSLKCLASKYTFSNVTWLNQVDDAGKTKKQVEFINNEKFSYYSVLKINNLTIEDSENYTCYGVKKDGTKIYGHIRIDVQKLKPPVLSGPVSSKDAVYRFRRKPLNCIAEGAPLPKIVWFKDEVELLNKSNIMEILESFNHTVINSTLLIREMQSETVGTYKCVAQSNLGVVEKLFTLSLKVDVKHTNIRDYLIAIGVIILLLFILVVYLSMRVKKEKRIRKQFRNELSAAGLLYFKEGVTKSINPKLGIDEQAELLPYDEKFEFPLEKLELGVQLGAGAFGVVYKAEARGIVDAEETTVVAVKMVKKGADNMYIKALATELKIMVHLGKHVNIVNLLGACTKNVDKRELAVIVEYCMFGNIHNYMQKHRDVFIDQLTDNADKNFGKVNRGFSSSSGAHSDYFDTMDTAETGHTFVNTANTVNSEQKQSVGYVQPEWRSNYQSDYSFDGRSPRPLTSRDLLAWAFQIARGMEYLASRKVLHGDLAARNILLAKDNVVKICDFGLARSIYKNSEYQKKESSPLPIKWLAIECMTSGIFSTQSDVWSFGIVLWELFSLAKTPYPNIHHSDLLGILSAGQRLEKPQYADDRLYELMIQCWNEKPTLRPSFTRLQELLGTCLEDNVRNYYIDLNSSYMVDKQKDDSHEDYLAMMCAPDYNNLVTPSPSHANNSSRFFPPSPARVDEEGYLQITPFHPKQGTEFNFDIRKFNAKTSEASSCGSERTPMLNLNNLPTRGGSESDHEGQNPYQNMTRIDEETDEVFTPKVTEARQNAKNLKHCAVTNPTYITFDADIEKNEKPKDIINSYVNTNVPNGLVK